MAAARSILAARYGAGSRASGKNSPPRSLEREKPAARVLGVRASDSRPSRRRVRSDDLSPLVIGAPLVASAALLALGTHWPQQFSWVVWVSLTPLFAAIRVLRPMRAAFWGAVWGLALWVFESVVGTHDEPWTVGHGVLLVTAPGLFSGVASWLTTRIGFPPFVLAVTWMLMEWAVRPLGLRLGVLGGVLDDGALLSGIGGAFGYVLAAFLAAYLGAVLIAFACHVLEVGDSRAHETGQCSFCFHLRELYISLIAPMTIHARAPPNIHQGHL